MSMKFIGKILFVISLVLMVFYFTIKHHKDEIVKLKSEIEVLKHQNDSLYSESSSREIRIQRYEYVLDRCNEEFSDDCRDHLNNILNQTE